jgi:hypothetical protein
MEIAAIVLELVGKLVTIGMDAYSASKEDGETIRTRMLAAMEEARAQLHSLPVELAENDRVADALAAAKR